MSHPKNEEEDYPQGVPAEDRPERFLEPEPEAKSNESGDQASPVDPKMVSDEPEPVDESEAVEEETAEIADRDG